MPEHLEASQPVPAPPDERVRGRRGGGRDGERYGDLSQAVIGNAYYRGLADTGMVFQDPLDLGRAKDVVVVR